MIAVGLALATVAGPAKAMADPGSSHDAGAEAAERGWLGVARREWLADMARGSGVAGGGDGARQAGAARDRLVRLDAVERAIAARAAARDASIAAQVAAEWSVAWRIGTAARPETAEIAIAAGLVLWNSGRAVHGVSLDGGRPPWQVAADARDTTIFPRGLAAAGRAATAETAAATVAAPPPCVVGSHGYAVLALADGSERLVCIDVSPAAEGRLVWSVDAADLAAAVARTEGRAGRTALAGAALAGTVFPGEVSFDGQPTADHELCLVAIRTVPDRGGLLLAAFAAVDGRLAWVRPTGLARTAAGDDLARGRRRACLAENRIAIVTHAGTVVAFSRDGSPAWTTATPVSAAPAGGETAPAAVPPADDAVFAAGRIVAAPRDTIGVVGLDPWSGAVAWHWSRSGETVDQLLGVAGDGVLVATADATGRSRLRRLAIEDGRELADHAASAPDGPRRRNAGRGTLVGGTVFWPTVAWPPDTSPAVGTAGELPVVEVLDARTLERRRDPLPLPDATGGRVTLAGAGAAESAGGILVACGVGPDLVCLRPGPSAAVQP